MIPSKKTILFMAILILLFSLGCRRQSGIDPGVIEYHKGTDGLKMEFVKNLPPDEIIEGNEFVIGLELRNKGAADIES